MSQHTALISWRRLWALCRKESYQILRDPSSILIAFVMPVMMLFIYGYAVNLDADHLRIGLLMQDNGVAAQQFEQAMQGSKSFELHRGSSRDQMQEALKNGEVRGIVIVPNDFSSRVENGSQTAWIQVLADGGEPNTAQFVSSQVQGIWAKWLQARAHDQATALPLLIDVQTRAWFNPSTVSRNFLVPGSISVVMTVIGALLTSLVVAREWERGTMEGLLATPVTRAELLLSKIIPYYFLGMTAMVLCLIVAVLLMGVPFRGSLFALWGMTSLFLASALGQGLFISTVLRTQFNAAQTALTAAFLPAMMLSGFVFEISSMPLILQWITHIIPARYLASSLQTLFQAGTVSGILWSNAFFLLLLSAFWLTMTAVKTRRSLD
jgi:ABC-2 type transport system permease protein